MTTIAEDTTLAARIQSGDIEARNELVLKNMGLVYRLAHQFSRYTNLQTDDLIGVGTVGLIDAANRFNPGKAKFSTYANHWIRKELLKAYGEARTIVYIPRCVWAVMSKKNKGKELTKFEEKRVYFAEQALKDQTHFTAKAVSSDCRYDQHEIDHVLASLAKLDKRTQEIIKYRFGMIDGEERTHKEIAEMFGISKQRICQIIDRAIGVLQMVAP